MIYEPRIGRIEILKKYGIRRFKTSSEFRDFKKDYKKILYEKQKGICALTNKPYPIEAMTFDHIVPHHLLRLLGFDEKERWDIENLVLASRYANSRKSHRILDRKRFIELFVRYWEASVRLSSFENAKHRSSFLDLLVTGYY